MSEHQPELVDDGLLTPEIGEWALKKYRLIRLYSTIFARSMKGKWHHRVYIDLFAAAGLARTKKSGTLVETSAIISLRTPDPFTHHVFCDKKRVLLAALRERVSREFPDASAEYICGDINCEYSRVIDALPKYGSNSRCLGFCLADPCGFSNLNFDTIVGLSQRYMDFLILIPTGMEGQRFIEQYRDLPLGAAPLDTFMGTTKWREAYDAKRPQETVDMFLTRFYDKQMKSIGYKYGGVHTSQLVAHKGHRNQRLYRLGFFSKNMLGETLWKEACRYVDEPRLF